MFCATVSGMSVEIHPGEGGDDAALFALELGQAIGRHVNAPVTSEGRIVIVETQESL